MVTGMLVAAGLILFPFAVLIVLVPRWRRRPNEPTPPEQEARNYPGPDY